MSLFSSANQARFELAQRDADPLREKVKPSRLEAISSAPCSICSV